MRLPALGLVVLGVFVTLAACGTSSDQEAVKQPPGGECASVSDCAATTNNGSCAWGFCSASCTTDADCTDDGAAGPTCTSCYNGVQVCCPAAGCGDDPHTGIVCATGEGYECQTDADCPTGHGLACHTLNDAFVFSCRVPCSTDAECPAGQSCGTSYGICE